MQRMSHPLHYSYSSNSTWTSIPLRSMRYTVSLIVFMHSGTSARRACPANRYGRSDRDQRQRGNMFRPTAFCVVTIVVRALGRGSGHDSLRAPSVSSSVSGSS